jgi:hypothetical protein
VRPDAEQPVWLCPPKRRRDGVEPELDLHGMPAAVPVLPDAQYSLPEAVGRLFDRTVLSRDALRPLADAWCRLSEGNLLRAGAVVRPLRAAAVARLALVGDLLIVMRGRPLALRCALTQNRDAVSGCGGDALSPHSRDARSWRLIPLSLLPGYPVAERGLATLCA